MDESNLFPVQELISGMNVQGMIDLEEYIKNEHLHRRKFEQCGRNLLAFFSKTLDVYGHMMLKDGIIPFENQIVVDLGAGTSFYGYYAAKALGAKAYVAVEPFFIDELYYNLHCAEKFKNKIMHDDGKKDIPVSMVPEDMLSFLRRVPANSISSLCAGIDWCVIDNSNYLRNVEKEILRTIDENGSYLNLGSDIIPNKLTKIYPTEDSISREDGVYKKI